MPGFAVEYVDDRGGNRLRLFREVWPAPSFPMEARSCAGRSTRSFASRGACQGVPQESDDPGLSGEDALDPGNPPAQGVHVPFQRSHVARKAPKETTMASPNPMMPMSSGVTSMRRTIAPFFADTHWRALSSET